MHIGMEITESPHDLCLRYRFFTMDGGLLGYLADTATLYIFNVYSDALFAGDLRVALSM